MTAVGATREATWSALLRGERGLREITLFDTKDQRATLAATVPDVEVREAPKSGSLVRDRVAGWSRSGVMALSAAREALAQAKVDVRRARVGLVVGGTTGGMYEAEERLAELHEDPGAHEALVELLSHPLTSVGDCLHEAIGPFVRVRTLSTACSSGANALVAAAAWLLDGSVDVVVAGGSDGLCRLTLTGFNALAAIDPEPCRPFDRRRRGLNLGEGAGFLVLEREESAKSRGARAIAQLAGWSSGAEAHHVTNPEPQGVRAASLIGAALARASVPATALGYVNAHGTATPLNDAMETSALVRALGEEARRVPVSSSKGQIGHTLGAAGAIEAAITALVVDRQRLVPTAGLEEPDEACRLTHVLEARDAEVSSALSSSFGFGGMDTALVFTRANAPAPERPAPRPVVVTAAAALAPRGLLGTDDAKLLLEPNDAGASLLGDPGATLDRARARRLDRAARMGAVVTARALAEAKLTLDDDRAMRTGVVLGSAFGSVDPSAAFMHRVFEKGPRLASPAEFPNLVPSSPVGHVSIYLGLRGPALAVADLGTSGECAFAQGVELVRAGEADRVVAGSLEERSLIAERRIAVLFDREEVTRRPRAEGAAVVVLEDAASAAARSARVLAVVADVREWRSEEEAPLASLPPPSSRAVVVLPRQDAGLDALLAASTWRAVPRRVCEGAGGEHEGLGAMALAAATSLLSARACDQALVVGLARGRGAAVRLVAP